MRTDKLSYRCKQCGGAEFRHPDNPKPADIMTCVRCGEIAKFGDAQWAAIEEAKKVLAKAFPGVESG